MAIPKKVDRRILDAIVKYRPILEQAKARDVNEADTVTVVKGLLGEVFGWDPFFEVTAEYAIRSTFVDLAVKSEDQIRYLIEVKAIGSDLRDNHLRQAVGYAANEGIEWVVLTNGAIWQAHKVIFGKPLTHELVFEIDFMTDNPRDVQVREKVFLLTKEGTTKAAIAQFHAERQALSKFNLAAVIRHEDVLQIIRRELRRAYPTLNPSIDQIRQVVMNDVLKREVVEGERAAEALKMIQRATRPLRKRAKRPSKSPDVAVPADPSGA